MYRLTAPDENYVNVIHLRNKSSKPKKNFLVEEIKNVHHSINEVRSIRLNDSTYVFFVLQEEMGKRRVL